MKFLNKAALLAIIAGAFNHCAYSQQLVKPKEPLEQIQKVGNNHVYSYKYEEGTYSFEVSSEVPWGHGWSYLWITSRFDGVKDGQLGSIQQEAAAVEKLLSKIQEPGRRIGGYKISRVFQREVISRVQQTAMKSDEWKPRNPEKHDLIMRDNIIKKCDAYRELREVFKKHGIKIESCQIEEVKTEQNPGMKSRLPRYWVTYITMDTD